MKECDLVIRADLGLVGLSWTGDMWPVLEDELEDEDEDDDDEDDKNEAMSKNTGVKILF